MNMQDFVMNECGDVNPLMKLVDHFTGSHHHGFAIAEDYTSMPQTSEVSMEIPSSSEMVREDQEHRISHLQKHTDIEAGVYSFNDVSSELLEISTTAAQWVNDFEKYAPSIPPSMRPNLPFKGPHNDWSLEFGNESAWSQSTQPYKSEELLDHWVREFKGDNVTNDFALERERFEEAWLKGKGSLLIGSASSDLIAETVPRHLSTTSSDMNLQRTASRFVDKIDDDKFRNSQFMHFVRKIKDDQVRVSADNGVVISASNELDSVPKQPHMNSESRAAKDRCIVVGKDEGASANIAFDEKQSHSFEAVPSAKEALCNDLTGSTSDHLYEWLDEFESSEWGHLDSSWKRGCQTGALSVDENEESGEYTPVSRNHIPDSYKFSLDNPYIQDVSPLDVGIELQARGDLASAVLAYEAAVQHDMNNSHAWKMLGIAHAENEQESRAISALTKALLLNERSLDALMALAVSYTNENCREQAYDCLEQWIAAHSDYCHCEENVNVEPFLGASVSGMDRHTYICKLFIEAARLRPDDVDADVQIGLGVLFNISNEYEKAIDCFQAGLVKRPDDATLWNRLGATLANSNRSEEAIGVYENALALKPGFVRVRYNLGVSCINLNAYEQAIEHLVIALTMQHDCDRDISRTILDTLRMVFVLQDKTDLVELVDLKNISALRRLLSI